MSQPRMEQHSFKLELPSLTTFSQAEKIALDQVVIPHMKQTGRNSYADLMVTGSLMGTAGNRIFKGTYML
ncbi:hypothetical protein AB0G00_30735 [Nocardia salmonicida]|uniref:hypothetical protein n=1 Tax=Nocardia salmonicida TaxID=53431 RepID=UPI003405DCBA